MRRLTYIYDRPHWPDFVWNRDRLTELLAHVRHQQGRLVGRMETLGFSLRQHAVLATLTTDVVKSSEIEGESLDLQQVRSSVARRLGMDIAGMERIDRHVDGVVEMMLDATRQFDNPLTEERLFGWHAAMFPTGRTGMSKIDVGQWRTDRRGPMRVLSGPVGKEHVHFEAPPARRLRQEMKKFLQWFNQDKQRDWVVDSALAHLWFVTIHPFDDGNGRIARAIADMALARSEQNAQRFYSLSAQIRKERAAYYDVLERTQKGDLDITAWMEWSLACLGRAIAGAEELLASVLFKAEFWKRIVELPLNERQRSVINRMLDGFEGKMTTSKWAKLTKSSQDTAARDITHLVELHVLERGPEGGRSTSYSLPSAAHKK